MGLENTSIHSAICYCNTNDPVPVFVLNRGFASIARSAGHPLGVFDLTPDVNTGGAWHPSECSVQVSVVALNDVIDPLATPPNSIDYRWRQNVNGAYYLQIRCIDQDVMGLENLSFSVKVERLN